VCQKKIGLPPQKSLWWSWSPVINSKQSDQTQTGRAIELKVRWGRYGARPHPTDDVVLGETCNRVAVCRKVRCYATKGPNFVQRGRKILLTLSLTGRWDKTIRRKIPGRKKEKGRGSGTGRSQGGQLRMEEERRHLLGGGVKAGLPQSMSAPLESGNRGNLPPKKEARESLSGRLLRRKGRVGGNGHGTTRKRLKKRWHPRKRGDMLPPSKHVRGGRLEREEKLSSARMGESRPLGWSYFTGLSEGGGDKKITEQSCSSRVKERYLTRRK